MRPASPKPCKMWARRRVIPAAPVGSILAPVSSPSALAPSLPGQSLGSAISELVRCASSSAGERATAPPSSKSPGKKSQNTSQQPSKQFSFPKARALAARAASMSDEELINALSADKMVCNYLQPSQLLRVIKLAAPFTELDGHSMMRLKTLYFFIAHSLEGADWGQAENREALTELACWLAEDKDVGRKRTVYHQLTEPIARAAVGLMAAGVLSVEQVAKLAYAYGRGGVTPSVAAVWPSIISYVYSRLSDISVGDLCRVLYALAEAKHADPSPAAPGEQQQALPSDPAVTAAEAGHIRRNQLFTAAAERVTSGMADGSLGALSPLDCATLAAAYTLAGVPAPVLMGALAHRATVSMLAHLPPYPSLVRRMQAGGGGGDYDSGSAYGINNSSNSSSDSPSVSRGWWMKESWNLGGILAAEAEKIAAVSAVSSFSSSSGRVGDSSSVASSSGRQAQSATSAGGAAASADDALDNEADDGGRGGGMAGLYQRSESLYGYSSIRRDRSAASNSRLAGLMRKIGRISRRGDSSSAVANSNSDSSELPAWLTSPDGTGSEPSASASSSASSEAPAAATSTRSRHSPDGIIAAASSTIGSSSATAVATSSSPPPPPPVPKVQPVDARAWVMLAWSLSAQQAWTAGEGVLYPAAHSSRRSSAVNSAESFSSTPLVNSYDQAFVDTPSSGGGDGSYSASSSADSSGTSNSSSNSAADQVPPQALAGAGAFFAIFRRLYPRMWQQISAHPRDVRRLMTVDAALRHMSPYPHLALSTAPLPPSRLAAASNELLLSRWDSSSSRESSSGVIIGPCPPHNCVEVPAIDLTGENAASSADGLSLLADDNINDLPVSASAGEGATVLADGAVRYALEPISVQQQTSLEAAAPVRRRRRRGDDNNRQQQPLARYGAYVSTSSSSSSASSSSSSSSHPSAAAQITVRDPLGNQLRCEVPRRSDAALVLQRALPAVTAAMTSEVAELIRLHQVQAAEGVLLQDDELALLIASMASPDAIPVPRLLPSYVSADGLLFDFADPHLRSGVVVVTPRMMRHSRDGLSLPVLTEYQLALAAGWDMHLVPAFDLPRAAVASLASSAAASASSFASTPLGGLLKIVTAEAPSTAADGSSAAGDEDAAAQAAAKQQRIDGAVRRLLEDISDSALVRDGGKPFWAMLRHRKLELEEQQRLAAEEAATAAAFAAASSADASGAVSGPSKRTLYYREKRKRAKAAAVAATTSQPAGASSSDAATEAHVSVFSASAPSSIAVNGVTRSDGGNGEASPSSPPPAPGRRINGYNGSRHVNGSHHHHHHGASSKAVPRESIAAGAPQVPSDAFPSAAAPPPREGGARPSSNGAGSSTRAYQLQ